MSSFNNYLEAALLNHLFSLTASYTQPSIYVALYTSAPTDAGGGTEATGGGYTRKGSFTGTSNWTLATGTNTVTNDNNIDFAASGGGWTVVAMSLMDAATAGNFLVWDAVASTAIADGETGRFPSSTGISVALD